MVISNADYGDSVRHLMDMGVDFGDIDRNDVFAQALIDGKIIKFKNHKPERMNYMKKTGSVKEMLMVRSLRKRFGYLIRSRNS